MFRSARKAVMAGPHHHFYTLADDVEVHASADAALELSHNRYRLLKRGFWLIIREEGK